VAWLTSSLRRLSDGIAPTVGLAIVVAITAFVFGAAPRLLGWAASRTFGNRAAGGRSHRGDRGAAHR
jgi:hypothetical protein